jgi:ribonuclease P protein component
LQVAFKVPSKNLNAVRRNRIKRLMREGFSNEREVLDMLLPKRGKALAVFFTFKGSKDISVERLKLNDVQSAIADMCRMIVSKLQRDA